MGDEKEGKHKGPGLFDTNDKYKYAKLKTESTVLTGCFQRTKVRYITCWLA